jgi:uncharacterized protein YndB with AHSA1/START domain
MAPGNYISARYTVEIKLATSPNDVFTHVVDLAKWWPEEFEGESLSLNSEFILKSGDGHYSKNKVTEWMPGKKVVWLTTDSLRKTDNFVWTGTKFIFELTPVGEYTLLSFTYDGVIFENEYEVLVKICDVTVNEMFYNFIMNESETDLTSKEIIDKSFKATIEVGKSPQHIFKCITNDVAKWWGGKDLEGSSTKLHDEFIVHHPNTHYSKQKLVEFIPNKRVVWLVTESELHWLKKDPHEWAGTKMIFEIDTKADTTVLHFTHEGIAPEKECYAMCSQGWDKVIKDWLFRFITLGEPHF